VCAVGREPHRPGYIRSTFSLSVFQPFSLFSPQPAGFARAGEDDAAAIRACDDKRLKDVERTSAEQRPSTGQDIHKSRRTEIEFLNGLVVREGEKLGLPCNANAALTEVVKRVERGELAPDPRHISDLRLN